MAPFGARREGRAALHGDAVGTQPRADGLDYTLTCYTIA